MLPSKGINVPTTPVFPGSTKKLQRPSDTEGALREYGIGTNGIWKLFLFFTVNANSFQTFWTKQSEIFFSLLSLITPQTTNASMRYVITYLADLRTHHYLLASLTKI